MLIRLFRSNAPSLIFLLVAYAIVLRLPFLFIGEIEPYRSDAPLGELIHFLVTNLLGGYGWLTRIIALALLFFQALLFNNWMDALKITDRPTYIPALVFLLATSFFPAFADLSAPLVANFIFLFFYQSLYNSYDKATCFGRSFDLGLLMGIGVLLYPPCIVLLPLLYLGFAILRPFIWREWVIGFFGLATVLFLTGTGYYLFTGLEGVQHYAAYLFEGWGIHFELPVLSFSDKINLGAVVFFLMICAAYIQANYLKSPILFRKMVQLMLFAIIVPLLTYPLFNGLTASHFLIISVPLSFFWNYWLVQYRLKFAELLHWCLFLTILSVHIWAAIWN